MTRRACLTCNAVGLLACFPFDYDPFVQAGGSLSARGAAVRVDRPGYYNTNKCPLLLAILDDVSVVAAVLMENV